MSKVTDKKTCEYCGHITCRYVSRVFGGKDIIFLCGLGQFVVSPTGTCQEWTETNKIKQGYREN